MRTGPKVLWVCVSDTETMHEGFERKKDVCCRFTMGERTVCRGVDEGCKPVKYVRAKP